MDSQRRLVLRQDSRDPKGQTLLAALSQEWTFPPCSTAGLQSMLTLRRVLPLSARSLQKSSRSYRPKRLPIRSRVASSRNSSGRGASQPGADPGSRQTRRRLPRFQADRGNAGCRREADESGDRVVAWIANPDVPGRIDRHAVWRIHIGPGRVEVQAAATSRGTSGDELAQGPRVEIDRPDVSGRVDLQARSSIEGSRGRRQAHARRITAARDKFADIRAKQISQPDVVGRVRPSSRGKLKAAPAGAKLNPAA